ncbi:unnamed protein product [Bursaphelenchus okinawaensis]|uniref:N-acetyllactosaminide beta-1,3-N-acetylglucosaminyltransferase n=1 Tax=Bursaphelenchus okinawaensis TaxID=465554 RepID=A0A811KL87_9BILA|nr:unnamed protein product [Bursaphelenchus okinawaensis]CAG9105555.1 unnamed protein product [Bursaphelenchus okinawaensis]
MSKLKMLRNVCFACFALVGVLQLRQNYATSDEIVHSRAERSAIYMQEITEIQQVRIRTMPNDEYCVAANIIQGKINETDRITLILHMSSDRLNTKKLAEHAKNWDGPISIAVVFPEETQLNSSYVNCAISKLQRLALMDKDVSEKLSVHFIVKGVTCEDFVLRNFTIGHQYDRCAIMRPKLSDNQQIKRMVEYPVNKARNVARKFVSTDYILSADMDHFFSKDFELKMRTLAKRVLSESPKAVLVYRIFEVSDQAKTQPKTKEDLHRLFLSYNAQEFHKYYGAHNIPKLYEWFMKPEKDEVGIQFYKPYTNPAWEPQFVSSTNIPLHDETFLYPLRDNTVLRWEMCRAGYKFAIVEDVFMYHLGYKEPGELKLTNQARDTIRKPFWHVLKSFISRMNKQYPTTKHKCPNFDKYLKEF